MDEPELEYVGFWLRAWASLIDIVLSSIVAWPLAKWFFPAEKVSVMDLNRLDLLSLDLSFSTSDWLLNVVLPGIAIILFWVARQATPGKMAIGARIVDAKTGGKPSTGQLVGRYFGYYPSFIVFCLGFFWVGFDPRKQGWHDKMAGTVVVRSKTHGKEPVKFS